MRTGRTGGFTLVEMMVAVLVLAVLLAISAPGLSALIKNNRLLSHVYAMRAALNGARSEALAQRSVVTVCRSSDGTSCSGTAWNQGYIAFIDADSDGEVDDPNNPQVFLAKVIDVDTLDIAYDEGDPTDPKDNIVRFDSQGYAREYNGKFSVCDERGASNARGVIVTPGGVVRALDPNEPITCP